MSKIIKLTESQLRDIVTRAINEQRNSPNASQAAKQVIVQKIGETEKEKHRRWTGVRHGEEFLRGCLR